jgi:hypothetical protein
MRGAGVDRGVEITEVAEFHNGATETTETRREDVVSSGTRQLARRPWPAVG